MKRRHMMALGASVPVAALGACGGDDGDGTLKFWLSGDANQGGGYQAMADKYEEETGVKVAIEDVPYDDFLTRIRNAAQAGELPDVGRVPSVDPLWMNQLQDLSDIAEERGIMDNLLVTGEDGEIVTLPSDLTAVGLFLNRTLFEEAGVAYPAADDGEPWTWDEFVAALREVKAGTDAKYGLVMDASSHRLRSFMYQFGSDGFVRDEDCVFVTDDAAATALEFFADINDDDIMPRSVWVSGDDPNALFKSGQVAAYYSGVWQVTDFSANIADFEWISAPMPAQTRRATNLGTSLMVAFEGDNAEAAREFVDWLYQEEHYRELTEISGFLPVIPDLEVTYRDSQESFDLYNEEIAASDPISGYQITSQLEMQYEGKPALEGDPLSDEAVKLANGEQDVPTTVQNILDLFNEQVGGCE